MDFQRERILLNKLAVKGLRTVCLDKRNKGVFSGMEDRNRFLQNMWKRDTEGIGFEIENTNEKILGCILNNFRNILFEGSTGKASYMQ